MESYTNVIHAKNLEIGYDTVLSKSLISASKERQTCNHWGER